jgi:hemolysin activation/secretion protein
MLLILVLPGLGFAAAPLVPGADLAKVKQPEDQELLKSRQEAPIVQKEAAQVPADAPAGFKDTKIKLLDLNIIGSTVYTAEELRRFYSKYLNKEITLDKIWEIAAQITKKYQDDGYFLSKAYVPKQEMEYDAKVVIRIFEGGIGDVNVGPKLIRKSFIRKPVQRISDQIPIDVRTMEENVLRLNDIPGVEFHTVLQKGNRPDSEENFTEMDLIKDREAKKNVVRFDNFGSRFLGPNKFTYVHEGSYIPYVDSSLTLSSSAPTGEIESGSMNNSTPLNYDTYLELNGSLSHAEPGYTIKPQEVVSKSKKVEINIDKKLIRTREENFDMRFGYEVSNTETDVFKTFLLSHDNVRAVDMDFAYNKIDAIWGSRDIDFSIKRGLDAFGATPADDPDASRSHTVPDFLKFELKLNFQRNILDNKYAIITSINGQYSDDSLYSGEEFGYGGSTMGRAYDDGELSGDKGIAGSLEVNYLKLKDFRNMTPVPYIFYDAGRVWNNNPGQDDEAAAASYGVGVRGYYKSLVTNLYVAVPSGRKIATPASGKNNNYRTGVSIQYNY